MIDITRAHTRPRPFARRARRARQARRGPRPGVLRRSTDQMGHHERRPPTRLLERSFGLYLHKLWFKQDACYTTDSVVGAIVWERPGQWKVGVLDQLRLLPSMARINGRLLPRILRAIAALESNHPVEPHYYLPLVGVDPEWQGRGLGTALMRPIVERCDTEKCRPTSKRPRHATARSTRATASRRPSSSRSGPGRRRCGGCGGLRSAELPPPPVNSIPPGQSTTIREHDRVQRKPYDGSVRVIASLPLSAKMRPSRMCFADTHSGRTARVRPRRSQRTRCESRAGLPARSRIRR